MCADDVGPDDRLKRGHINRVVGLAIEAGIAAPLAIRYATLNGARCVIANWTLELSGPATWPSWCWWMTWSACLSATCMVADGELNLDVHSGVAPPPHNTMVEQVAPASRQ